MLYADIEKLQTVVAQQQINPADVSYLDLEHTGRILQENKDVKAFIFLTRSRKERKGRDLGVVNFFLTENTEALGSRGKFMNRKGRYLQRSFQQSEDSKVRKERGS